MKKLSKTQLEILQELSKKDVFLYYMPYMGRLNQNAYWFSSDSMGRIRCSTVQALSRNNLIRIFGSLHDQNTIAKITDKGKEWLEEVKQKKGE